MRTSSFKFERPAATFAGTGGAEAIDGDAVSTGLARVGDARSMAQQYQPEGPLEEESSYPETQPTPYFGSEGAATPGPGSVPSWVPAGPIESVEPGRVLFGKYRVLELLGRGGMGSVWRVEHTDLQCERALKLIESRFLHENEARSRFRREGRVMARFSHPHAVSVHDARLTSDAAFIEMELVRGRSLDRIIERGRPMPLAWVAQVAIPLFDVLAVAHAHQIVHRDLKPSNLMLLDGRPEGREFLKVLDFGIAKVLDSGTSLDDPRTQAGHYIGTAVYSSPEQIEGGDVDGRSDIYSVGVLLYELLTGHRPFGGPHALAQHLMQPPPPFAAKNAEARVPAEIERLVLRCLAKSPSDRPQTAEELASEFSAACANADTAILAASVKGGDRRVASASEAMRGPEDRPIPPVDAPTAAAPSRSSTPPAEAAKTVVTPVGGGGLPPDAPAPRSEPMSPNRRGPAPAPWSQAWLGRKLKEPKVLYPLLGTILIPALLYVFLGGPSEPKHVEETARAGQGDVSGEKGGKKATKAQADEDAIAKARLAAARTKAEEKEAAEALAARNERAAREKEARRKETAAEDKKVDKPELASRDPKIDAAHPAMKNAQPRDATEPKIGPKPAPTYADLPPTWTIKAPAMRLVRIKPGKFRMGSPDGQGDPNEHPEHEVEITRPFYIGETEVTQAQYRQVMDGRNPSYFARGGQGEARLGGGDAGDHPVDQVSYNDARDFCRALASRLGVAETAVRLPTEAEWEFAARGPSGADPADLPASSWFKDNAGGKTHPVKSRAPNANGLYDVAGNVAEWCADWIDAYPASAKPDPVGPDTPGDKARRVLRGGSWLGSARACRPVDRNGDDPDTRTNLYGFRVVLDADAALKLMANPGP